MDDEVMELERAVLGGDEEAVRRYVEVARRAGVPTTPRAVGDAFATKLVVRALVRREDWDRVTQNISSAVSDRVESALAGPQAVVWATPSLLRDGDRRLVILVVRDGPWLTAGVASRSDSYSNPHEAWPELPGPGAWSSLSRLASDQAVLAWARSRAEDRVRVPFDALRLGFHLSLVESFGRSISGEPLVQDLGGRVVLDLLGVVLRGQTHVTVAWAYGEKETGKDQRIAMAYRKTRADFVRVVSAPAGGRTRESTWDLPRPAEAWPGLLGVPLGPSLTPFSQPVRGPYEDVLERWARSAHACVLDVRVDEYQRAALVARSGMA